VRKERKVQRTIHAYLTFNGNCREAMQFYQRCLGGELIFQTIGESPVSLKMPDSMKDYILHASLTSGDMVLLGTDMVGEHGLIHGNAVSMVLHCGSVQETERLYDSLSSGGERTHPLEISFWGALSGDLIDRYGNPWVLHCANAAKN
jgi:PhnB protein